MKTFAFIAAAAVAAMATSAEAQDQGSPPDPTAPLPGLRGNGLQPDMTRLKAQQMATGCSSSSTSTMTAR